MISRADRSPIAEWWRTVDRPTLLLAIGLMLAGLLISLAASPPVAERMGLDPYHFVRRQAMFVPLAVLLLLSLSFLTPRMVRRVAVVSFFAGIGLMLVALAVGPEVKGAQRWLPIAGMSLQPSELAKPSFVILVAWLFAEDATRPDIPGRLFAIIMLVVFVALLLAQPDFGQSLLVCITWGSLFFLSGMSWVVAGLALAVGLAGAYASYIAFPHVSRRIDAFLDPSSSDTFQVDTALEAFRRGGWIGSGPGEGIVKRVLPDGHNDFVYAVIAEEFGILMCLGLLAVFTVLVLRGLTLALRKRSAFERLAIAGLITLFGVQAFINMGVSLQLLPAKGMALPFLSYGGSALLSVALLFGYLLALTRRRFDEHGLARVVPRAI